MRNKARSILLFAGILAILVPMGYAQGFSGAGSGTEQDPYIITNVYQLQEMNDHLNDPNVYFELGNDIDASETKNWNGGAGFTPIGNHPNYFTVHFDGKGHKITGLYISRSSSDSIGLFSRATGSGSVIKNVGLVNVDVNTVNGNFIGGLVGVNYGTITNCYSTGSVSGCGGLGGLVGYNHYPGTITNCYSTGSVSSGCGGVGGLVGGMDGSITNCYSTGSVTGSYNVGGLVGYNYYRSGTITNCYSTASVSGYEYVGGLVGYYYSYSGPITNCYSTGGVTGSSYVGGLVGYGGEVVNSFWDIQTSGWTTSAGGIGKTTAEMKQKATFTNWDFDIIWDIIEGQTYPFLIGIGPPASYIHQCYDTPQDFCGSYACGATSTVMVLASFNRIVGWPCESIGSYDKSGQWKREGTHTSNYGNYISKEYMYAGETWDENTPDSCGRPAGGAYGYIHNPDQLAHASKIEDFLTKHGILGAYTVDDRPDENFVKSELGKGNLVIASTKLTTSGHIVLITGYNSNSGRFIVNDPFGSKPYGDAWWGNYNGANVEYTWTEMDTGNKWIVVVPRQYQDLPNSSPPAPDGFAQFMSNQRTEIRFGRVTGERKIVLAGMVSDNVPDHNHRDSVRLEVELRRLSEYEGRFTDEPTHRSDFVTWYPSGRKVSITIYGLIPASYHWQARTMDIRGETSNWVRAGDNNDNEPDFSVFDILTHLCSPADIILTDPDGLTISKSLNQIPDAVYTETDIDGDGHIEDDVQILNKKIGDYTIAVVPEPNALPTDTYSLDVTIDGQTMVLAQDVKIQDIPEEPYQVESKLIVSDFDNDTDVDFADLAKLSYHWLSQDCNYPSWCEGTDLNYSGRINFVDFAIFAENWLWERIPADLNIDGDIDFIDYAGLAGHWGDQTCIQPNWCERADINKSGSVDLYDLYQFAEHWLEGR